MPEDSGARLSPQSPSIVARTARSYGHADEELLKDENLKRAIVRRSPPATEGSKDDLTSTWFPRAAVADESSG